ncbi:hypothetical protein J6W34_00055 [bacterium]|nr:hypothetical protein [bacterium]
MSTIDQFRQKLLRGGHRTNRFRVTVDFPTRTLENAAKAQESFEFLAFAANVPTQALGEIPVKFRGRTVYFAGDPAEPEEWTCSVYNSISFDVRNACINWRNNYIRPDSVTGEDLIDTSTVTIELLDKSDVAIQKVVLNNAWVKSIGQIQTSWETENEISRFDLTIRYDWVEETPVAGSNGVSTVEG